MALSDSGQGGVQVGNWVSSSSGLLDVLLNAKDGLVQVTSLRSRQSAEVLQWLVPVPSVQVPLLALLVSLSYCFTSISSAVLQALRCVRLDWDSKDEVAGVFLAPLGRFWAADMEQASGGGQHTAAVVVTVLVGTLKLC